MKNYTPEEERHLVDMANGVSNDHASDIQRWKREELEKYERKERQRSGGSGKIRNPMTHLTPKKEKRKK